jgi:DNA-binding CsgD family transcriptional regulator
VASEIAEHEADDSLTPGEIEILEQVAAGNSRKTVGVHLEISEDTEVSR